LYVSPKYRDVRSGDERRHRRFSVPLAKRERLWPFQDLRVCLTMRRCALVSPVEYAEHNSAQQQRWHTAQQMAHYAPLWRATARRDCAADDA
jgi:hypothetical protein